MDLADLQARVRIALTSTLVDEWTLFAPTAGTSRPSARSVAFHLGWYLRQTIPRDWDVDSAYDRSGMLLEESVRFEARQVPDLIAHHRGLLGPEHNLLLAHVFAAEGDEDEPRDLSAAAALQHRFGYRYALLLDLRLEVTASDATVAPHWHWSTLESGAVTPGPVPVYTDAALAEVKRRARR